LLEQLKRIIDQTVPEYRKHLFEAVGESKRDLKWLRWPLLSQSYLFGLPWLTR